MNERNIFWEDLEDTLNELENDPNSEFVKATKSMISNCHSEVLSPEQIKYLLRAYNQNMTDNDIN